MNLVNTVTFQSVGNEIYLRFGQNNIIELTGAEEVQLEVGDNINYFGNFIIVRDENNRWKHPQGFFSPVNQLGLSFDGSTVAIKRQTQPKIFGKGVMYVNKQVAFYTTSVGLIERITDALEGDPGDIPTPPPNQGYRQN